MALQFGGETKLGAGWEYLLNQNLIAFARGMHFRIEISAANGLRSNAEFAHTKAEAMTRRRQLRTAGYVASIFSITRTGGLTAVA